MIEIAAENLLTLPDAAARLPRRGRRKVHVCTIYRWMSRGVRGVKLEAIKLGGVTYTSVEALQRFANRCSGAPPPRVQPPSRRRAAAIQRAERELDDAGM